jgi:hypothetical protein
MDLYECVFLLQVWAEEDLLYPQFEDTGTWWKLRKVTSSEWIHRLNVNFIEE